MRVDVRGDVRAVLQDIGFTVPSISRKSQVTALNKTAAKIKTQMGRAVAKDSGVKLKEFKSQLKQFRATPRTMSAKIWFGQRRGIQLIRLSDTPTGKYDELASYSLYGKSGAEAFKATTLTGRKRQNSTRMTGFFVREGRSRLPISLVRVQFKSVGPEAMQKAVNVVGRDEFKNQFIYDMRRRLARTNMAGRRSGNPRRR